MSPSLSASDAREARLKRLIYRSVHRGCKETDLIFAQFAELVLPALAESELDDYESLLEEADADIWQWIVSDQNNTPASYLALIQRLRQYRPQ